MEFWYTAQCQYTTQYRHINQIFALDLFRLRQILQDASRIMFHGKREYLMAKDIDMALKASGLEPLYGSVAGEHIPFRFASGGGRELHFGDDKVS